MRIFSPFSRNTATMTAFIWLVFTLSAFAAGEPIGEVASMEGTVIAEQSNGTIRNLDLNLPVMAHETIVTGMHSHVEIHFNDDSIYSQGPESRIALDEFVYSEDTSASKLLFKMGKGTFRYVTGQIVKTNPDAFALQTPTTTIGIRGTEIFAVITPEKEEIGNTKLSKGHTMTVGARTLGSPRTSVSVNPKTGEISKPTPVSQKTINKVIKHAPMTSLGELGVGTRSRKDLNRKIQAFKQQMDRTKGSLSGVNQPPDYAKIHRIKQQKDCRRAMENSRNKGGPYGDFGGSEGKEQQGGEQGPTDGPDGPDGPSPSGP
ncbi:hypothetical protein GO013_07650 [Pseudodesulfovibrio sp. JC047]|uniref:FecR family protein n=1 Tax=Pseudodesulfovibrio sp. JC047 TaxID=2683199 RepID=UPI0013D09481|nr:FecR domain-containing protein [Pseudodesulfovibrio sp. JC047]NDV19292.1 hypothetical protein [Pseudodesulfovibrio sp. JC047]